jgi:hypothetical protein
VSNHPFRPLRHRSVRLNWSAAAISDIGTWVQLFVVGSLVAADTGSAVQTGLVALATFMPQGIASPMTFAAKYLPLQQAADGSFLLGGR